MQTLYTPDLANPSPFLPNKYTKWYYGIISMRGKSEPSSEEYYEKHHIVPDSLFVNNRSKGRSPGFLPGDPNTKSNLICLTLREHFICHWLLTKMVEGQWRYKMERALHYFRFDRYYTDNRLTSLEYARAKTASRKASLGRSAKGRGKGSPHTKQVGKVWCTNGNEDRLLHIIPEGWTRGRSSMKGKPAYNKGKPSPLRGQKTGRPSPWLGRTHTPETIALMKAKHKGKISPLRGIKAPHCGRPGVAKRVITCPYCGKEGGEPQLKRWHFDKCPRANN